MKFSRVDATARQREKRGATAGAPSSRRALDAIALQMIANTESMAVDTAATIDRVAKEMRTVRKIMRTRIEIAEAQIRELSDRLAILETGRAEQSSMAEIGLPTSRGRQYEREDAELGRVTAPARLTRAQRLEAGVEECRQKGAQLADALIDFAIAAYNSGRDPTDLVKSIKKRYGDEWTRKRIARTDTTGCEAFAWGWTSRAKERRKEVVAAYDAMIERLGLKVEGA